MKTYDIVVSSGSRKCRECGENNIKKGDKHFAIFTPNGHYGPKRDNYCHTCSVKKIAELKAQLCNIEEELYGPEGA